MVHFTCAFNILTVDRLIHTTTKKYFRPPIIGCKKLRKTYNVISESEYVKSVVPKTATGYRLIKQKGDWNFQLLYDCIAYIIKLAFRASV